MHGISPEQYEESVPQRDAPKRAKRARRVVSMPVVVAIAVVMALLGGSAALAAPGVFSDVPDDHPFADSIGWMADTGISEGYADGTYKPGNAVSRQAMSSFMQRLYDLQDDMSYATSASTTEISSLTFVDVPGMTTTVIVPDGVWANISARYNAESAVLGPTGSWGTVRFVIKRNSGTFAEMQPVVGTDFAWDTVSSSSDFWEAHAFERVTEVSGGTYTIKVQARTQAAGTTFSLDDMALVAETDLQPSDYVPS